VIMGAPGEVDDHNVTTLPHRERSSETVSIAPISWMVHVQPEAETRGLVIRVSHETREDVSPGNRSAVRSRSRESGRARPGCKMNLLDKGKSD
jgi:hypothetical protein